MLVSKEEIDLSFGGLVLGCLICAHRRLALRAIDVNLRFFCLLVQRLADLPRVARRLFRFLSVRLFALPLSLLHPHHARQGLVVMRRCRLDWILVLLGTVGVRGGVVVGPQVVLQTVRIFLNLQFRPGIV